MCRNFVAKNDFNRGGAHKSEKDYRRVSMYQILEAEDVDVFEPTMEEDWGVYYPYPTKPEDEGSSNKAPSYWVLIHGISHL